jgi:DNA repair protein RadC
MNARLERVQNNAPYPADALLGANPPAGVRPAVTRIPDWPERDRSRERLLQLGAQTLSDAELLALFLNTGRPGMTSVDVACDLLVRFESIRGVPSTTATELRTFGGIGPAKAALLLAVSELCQRSLAEKTRERPLLDAPQAVEDYLK